MFKTRFVNPSIPDWDSNTHSALIRTPTLLVLQRVRWSVPKPHSSVQMALFRLHGNLTEIQQRAASSSEDETTLTPSLYFSASDVYISPLPFVSNLSRHLWMSSAQGFYAFNARGGRGETLTRNSVVLTWFCSHWRSLFPPWLWPLTCASDVSYFAISKLQEVLLFHIC